MSIRRILKVAQVAAIVWGCLFWAGTISLAQSTNATLNGVVTDTTGAVLPGVSLSITNVDTNQTEKLVSNGAGEYSINTLVPGQYMVVAERAGFRKSVTTGVVLSVAQVATLNIQLQAGAIQETVTVSANVEVVNTTTAEIGSVITQSQVTEMPLNGRNPASLAFLSPGVVNINQTAGGFTGSLSGLILADESGGSSNGGRQGSTYYLLDGAPNMDNYGAVSYPFPNSDATQEFNVISNNFDAHYGFSPSAVASVQTKSGTNTWHGGVFEFLRNSDLNAGNYFSHAVDPLRRNQFGGYAGGKLIKDKFFLFANYQQTKASTQAATNTGYFPTAAMLRGDFSAVPVTLKAPFATINGKPNQIDPSRFSTAAVAIANQALPLGQDPTSGFLTYATVATTTPAWQGIARLDYNLSSTQNIFLRHFVEYSNINGGDIPGNIKSGQMSERAKFFNESLGDTWTINPTTVNVFNLSWVQLDTYEAGITHTKSGDTFCLSKFIPSVSVMQCYEEGLGIQSGQGFGPSFLEPAGDWRTTIGISEELDKTLGKHMLSFGGIGLHQQNLEANDFPGDGLAYFGNTFTGLSLADFLMGYVGTWWQGGGELVALKGWQPGLFVQDQYHVTPGLTLTLGLRWDPNLPPASQGGRGAAYHPGQQSIVYPNAPLGVIFPGDPGLGDGLMPTSYGYYEPRIGIAYTPRKLPNTVIHAAFGMFTSPLIYSWYSHAANLGPFSPNYEMVTNLSSGPIIKLDEPWNNSLSPTGSTTGASPFPPFTSFAKPPTNSTFGLPMSLNVVFSNDFKLGVTQSWNASIEQQISRNFSMRVAYVGSESYHQAVIFDQNPGVYALGGKRANANYANIGTDWSMGTASYNSLQITATKRFSYGLQFQSNFTWSKAIDESASGDQSTSNYGFEYGNLYDPKWNHGISALNMPLIWVSNLIYVTPALRGQKGIVRNTLGGWEFSIINTAQSGLPFSIQGGNGNDNSLSLQNYDRADLVSKNFGAHQGSKQQWIANYFNHAAFAVNKAGTWGNSGKNILATPAVNTADIGLIKNWDWSAHEDYRLQFRWEMYNAFNHASFGMPDRSPTDPTFGKITAIGYIPPRVMQAGLKLTF